MIRPSFAPICVLSFGAAICASVACGGGTPSGPNVATPGTPSTTAAAVTPTAPSAEVSRADSKGGKAPAVVWRNMATPESVLYDEAGDRYLVSNVNGKPLDLDNNGFISELSPDGIVKKLKFIEGGARTTLHAPKGLALANSILYVADIDTVRSFDARTGAPISSIKIPGATFLNDIGCTGTGFGARCFVSDSGLKADGAGLAPTGTDAIYEIWSLKSEQDFKLDFKLVFKDPSLRGPNGVLYVSDRSALKDPFAPKPPASNAPKNVVPDGGSWVVASFQSNEIYSLNRGLGTEEGSRSPSDWDGKAKRFLPGPTLNKTPLPDGKLDGIAQAGDTLLVSSWAGSAIYQGKIGSAFTVVVPNVRAPADIAYDAKRKRVLVPRFLDDVVEAYDLP